MSGPWQILDRRRVLDVPWMRIRRDRVRPPGGPEVEYYVWEAPDWVTVVPVDEGGRLLVVRQYRHGIGRWTWEFPAGTLDREGEEVLASAARELREETGWEAGRLELVGRVAPSPPKMTNWNHVVLALGCRPAGRPSPGPLERPMEVATVRPEELGRWIREGRFVGESSVVAFFLAMERLEGEGGG